MLVRLAVAIYLLGSILATPAPASWPRGWA